MRCGKEGFAVFFADMLKSSKMEIFTGFSSSKSLTNTAQSCTINEVEQINKKS